MIGLFRTILFSILLLGIAGAVLADVVVLYNGDHVEGEIVEESDDEISLLTDYGIGNIKYIRKIKRSRIVRIDKGEVRPRSRPMARVTSRPVTTKPQLPCLPTREQTATLASLIARYKNKEYATCGSKVTRLINRATPGQLHRLSEKVKGELGIALADLAAEIRLADALARNRRSIRLKYVTRYEKPSLIRLLTYTYNKALRQEIKITRPGQGTKSKPSGKNSVSASRPAGTQPAGTHQRVCTIAGWLNRPTDYDGDQAESEAFAEHIGYALSLLRERIHMDREARTNRKLRNVWIEEKSRLSALERAVVARSRGALTPEEKAAILAERQRQLDLYRAELERQRREQDEYGLTILEQIVDDKERKDLIKKFRKNMERQKKERDRQTIYTGPKTEENPKEETPQDGKTKDSENQQ